MPASTSFKSNFLYFFLFPMHLQCLSNVQYSVIHLLSNLIDVNIFPLNIPVFIYTYTAHLKPRLKHLPTYLSPPPPWAVPSLTPPHTMAPWSLRAHSRPCRKVGKTHHQNGPFMWIAFAVVPSGFDPRVSSGPGLQSSPFVLHIYREIKSLSGERAERRGGGGVFGFLAARSGFLWCSGGVCRFE